MADDVLAEIDRWLVSRASLREATVSHALLQGAREEIVALRTELQDDDAAGAIKRAQENVRRWIREAREEALEEAARVCEGGYTTGSTASTLEAIAKAIRALKVQ